MKDFLLFAIGYQVNILAKSVPAHESDLEYSYSYIIFNLSFLTLDV